MTTRLEEIKRRHIASINHHLGRVILDFLDDPSTTDVCLNPDGKLWWSRIGHRRMMMGEMTPGVAMDLIGGVASTMGRQVTADEPLIEGHLITDGSRFLGGIPPVVSAPFFCIRKHRVKVTTLSQYVEEGMMSHTQLFFIRDAVRLRKNIVISGGTGSGKTTLMNAIVREMSTITPHHRFFAIEQVPELQVAAADKVMTLTTDNVSIRNLVSTAMRAYSDRILIGEARGGEMLDILQVWNTGHDGGCATIHSNVASPTAALERIEDLVSMADNPPAHPQRMIARTVNVVICIEVDVEMKRSIRQIVNVLGYDTSTQAYEFKQEL